MPPASPLKSDIWTGIIRLQRKTRMMSVLEGLRAGRASTELTFTEGLTLHIVATLRETNVKQISEILRLERSWISRIVSSLQKKSCVESFELESDRRVKGVRLSAVGRELLVQLNDQRRHFFNGILSMLSETEVKTLAQLLKDLADGFGSPRFPAALDPHPVDFELARLSWSIGVVGNNYIGTDFSVSQYHIVSVLAEEFHNQAVSVSEIHELLPIDLSTLSRALDAFAEDGIVEKEQSKRDKRSFQVKLSIKGKKAYQKMVSTAASACHEASRSLSQSKQKRLAKLLAEITEEMPTRTAQTVSHHIELKKIPTSELHSKCSELGKRADSYQLFLDGKPMAVIGAIPDKEDGRYQRVLFSAGEINSEQCLELLRHGLSKLS